MRRQPGIFRARCGRTTLCCKIVRNREDLGGHLARVLEERGEDEEAEEEEDEAVEVGEAAEVEAALLLTEVTRRELDSRDHLKEINRKEKCRRDKRFKQTLSLNSLTMNFGFLFCGYVSGMFVSFMQL
jgi:hypothetical protein